jgi:hypothetical protein
MQCLSIVAKAIGKSRLAWRLDSSTEARSNSGSCRHIESDNIRCSSQRRTLQNISASAKRALASVARPELVDLRRQGQVLTSSFIKSAHLPDVHLRTVKFFVPGFIPVIARRKAALENIGIGKMTQETPSWQILLIGITAMLATVVILVAFGIDTTAANV